MAGSGSGYNNSFGGCTRTQTDGETEAEGGPDNDGVNEGERWLNRLDVRLGGAWMAFTSARCLTPHDRCRNHQIGRGRRTQQRKLRARFVVANPKISDLVW